MSRIVGAFDVCINSPLLTTSSYNCEKAGTLGYMAVVRSAHQGDMCVDYISGSGMFMLLTVSLRLWDHYN